MSARVAVVKSSPMKSPLQDGSFTLHPSPFTLHMPGESALVVCRGPTVPHPVGLYRAEWLHHGSRFLPEWSKRGSVQKPHRLSCLSLRRSWFHFHILLFVVQSWGRRLHNVWAPGDTSLKTIWGTCHEVNEEKLLAPVYPLVTEQVFSGCPANSLWRGTLGA